MALSIGIVGLPNAGKSTLFNALTNNKVLAAAYPFATIEPNTGIVPVPDPRLDKLAELYQPEKVVPATVTFVDIAGLVEGAHKGEGLGNQFLAHIREVSAIAEVVRVFKDDNVAHVAERIDPANDISTINTELMLADVQTLDKHLAKLRKQVKADPKILPEIEALDRLRAKLDKGELISAEEREQEELKSLHLLTAKPFIYVFNLDEADLKDTKRQSELADLVKPAQSIFICAKVEAELAELDKKEAQALLKELGQSESGLEQLIHTGFSALGLQTFLTAGPKEVRAWTIPIGTKAPQAAGVIHGDFERGFIAAEVVSYDDLKEAGSKNDAKAAGKLRSEGKDYTVQDGDVIEFRFNL